LGSIIGGLFKAAVGFGGPSAERTRAFHYGYGEGHSCRMRFQRRNLVAESKPLNILYQPDACGSCVPGMKAGGLRSLPVIVTFGSDGKVQYVESVKDWRIRTPEIDNKAVWGVLEDAARGIQFVPETVNGLPVTVTREVEIHFIE
ncbi:MAG: hypothetical protein ACJ74Q_06810, partial [Pyrinomonadaceae bacterium]